jgi:hypothetical protein
MSKRSDRFKREQLLRCMIEDKKFKKKYGERPKPPTTRRDPDERKKVLVFGTRTFDDYRLLKRKMGSLCRKLDDPILVVGEDNYGVGKQAMRWASWNWFAVKLFLPNFSKYRKPACFHVRNREMVDYCKAHKGVAVAFWDGESPRTKETIKLCRKAGIKLVVVRYEP